MRPPGLWPACPRPVHPPVPATAQAQVPAPGGDRVSDRGGGPVSRCRREGGGVSNRGDAERLADPAASAGAVRLLAVILINMVLASQRLGRNAAMTPAVTGGSIPSGILTLVVVPVVPANVARFGRMAPRLFPKVPQDGQPIEAAPASKHLIHDGTTPRP